MPMHARPHPPCHHHHHHQAHEGTISIKELSEVTAIRPDDILNTFQMLNLIQYQKGQVGRGGGWIRAGQPGGWRAEGWEGAGGGRIGRSQEAHRKHHE
jgi:hypothetical protein